MIRIAALNDSSSEEDSRAPKTAARTTKEAKESEAFTLYDAALRLQRQGEEGLAEAAFKDLLHHVFLRETAQLVEDEEEGADQDGLRLLYSIHKNLASVSLHRGDLESAIWSYVEAVKIDTTEVTVWYKIGTIALKLYNFPLARLGFEKGLHCNPNHWPCLDHIVTLLYAMNDYWNCLYYISRALEKDPEYSKGLVLRKQILKEQPSLKYDTEEMFEQCDQAILIARVDPSESQEYINEALDLRDRRRELAKEPEPLPIKLPKAITHFTWMNLGESLVELYDRAVNSDPPLSLGLRVDLSEYSNCTDVPRVVPAKSPAIEETTDHSGEMEVDSVPVITKEIQSIEDQKKDGTRTSEVLDVLMVMEESAAACSESQIDKDNVAMDTDEIQDQMDTKSSVVPSTSIAIMPSSPLSTATVSQQANVISMTDSPRTTADVRLTPTTVSEPMQATAGTGLPLTVSGISGTTDIGSTVTTVCDLPESTSEEEHLQTSNKERQSYTGSLTGLQQSFSVSELQETTVLPKILSKTSPLQQMSDVSEPPQTTAVLALPSGVPVTSSGLPVTTDLTDDSCFWDVEDITYNRNSSYSNCFRNTTINISECTTVTTCFRSSADAIVRNPCSWNSTGSVNRVVTDNRDATLITSVRDTTDITWNSIDNICLKDTTTNASFRNSTFNACIRNPTDITCVNACIRDPTDITCVNACFRDPTDITCVDACIRDPTDITCVNACIRDPTDITCVNACIRDPTDITCVDACIRDPTDITCVNACIRDPTDITCVNACIRDPTDITCVDACIRDTTDITCVNACIRDPTDITCVNASNRAATHNTFFGNFVHNAFIRVATHNTSVRVVTHNASVRVVTHNALFRVVTSFSIIYTSLHDHTCAASLETDDLVKGRGKAPKRKRAFIPEDFGLSVKRRSARVRNVSKPKEEPSVNFEELLISFLPSSLKQLNEEEDTEMLVVQEQSGEEKTTGGEVEMIPEEQKLAKSEDTEVREFLKQNIKNGGTICLMLRYLFILAKYGETNWPMGLTDVFLKVYSRTRKHFDMPDIFSLGECEEYTQNLGKTCQLAAEFQLDQWIVNNRMSLSPGSSPRSPGSQQLHTSDLPPHCNDDLWFITGLTGCGEVMGSNWLPHCIRVYWMKARFYMLQGKMDDALYCFQKTFEYLEYAEKQGEPTKICLVNCKMDRLISIDQVKSHQESLHRCQSLDETQKLYESGNYEKVVDFILQTFTQPQLKGKTMAFRTAIPERQSQLLLLQDSLYKMEAHKKGMVWGEVSFNEAVQYYKRASTSEQKDAWSATLTQICENLIRVLDKKDDVLKDVPSINLVRLARNLINIIDTTMAAPDIAVEMPIGTVLPWILLYKLIKFEENKIRSMQVSTPEAGQTDLLDGMPSYLMLLNIAHEYLARHSWCTKSNGSLLLFYLDVAQEFLTGSCQFKRDLEQSYEQCVYCLFGHPNKKGRARHLMDHNASQIDLTWDSAQKIFEYFKPNSVPEFDSYKADAVSGDMEFLLKRIAQLVPESEKPAKLMENLQEYIEGNTNIPPNPETKHLSTVSKELYYLLADYYFKNKEQAKAVRFYMSDICMNPTRLDSWAGMGLARMSQLEQKLSSTALKMDMPIYRKSIGALRCFRRAVEIDDCNAKLWIEYGSLAYQLHSHASRQLKWKNWFPLTAELEQIASDSRQEMLQTAFNCYKKASECESEENEEEWLQHYMMAKCLEKMRKPPKEYLENYKKAANYLYEENATFPKKIVYAYTTPHLAVESLEMFYRIHVSIMKILLKNKTVLESDLQLFQRYIKEAANSPFARCQERRQESTATLDGTLLPVGQGTKTGGKRSKVMPMDHTYSKQKSMVEGSATDSATSDFDQVTTPKPVSMVTHREVQVVDPSNATAGSMMELSAENLDEHLTVAESVDKEKEEVDSATTVEKSAVPEQGQGDTAVDKESEGDGFFLDEVTGIVKQASFGFDVKGDTHLLDRGDSADVVIGTKDKYVDKVMKVSSQEEKSNDNAMEVSAEEDKILSEDKVDGQKMDKDDDSSLSEFDVEALLSEYLPTDHDKKTSSDDKKSTDIIQQDEGQTTDVKSSDLKEGGFDQQEDEKSLHSVVRELSQGNESMESETRQYGDMNLPEDQEGGAPIDPSELSLSKGLRERMAQELEGDLVSKYEQGQSVVGMETESKPRKDQKSVSSLSDDDDELGESLDDSYLSGSSDSIPDSLGSPSRSAADSLSKSGDSLSKSGGFLAQFNQFLSKKIIPDDIISESSPEKSLSSPLKASRSQSPSSQIFMSDADTGLKVHSQQDTISSVGMKEDLTSVSSNLSPKNSTHSDSANQNQDSIDVKEKKIETVLSNQNPDDKKEPLSMDEKSEDVNQPVKSGADCQPNICNRESNMDVDDIKDVDRRKKDENTTTFEKDEEFTSNDEAGNFAQNLQKNIIGNKTESTTNQEQRVGVKKMEAPEIESTTNQEQKADDEKITVIEEESTTNKELKADDEKMDEAKIDSITCQGQRADDVEMEVDKVDLTTSKEQKLDNVKIVVIDMASTVGTGERADDEKMDVDNKDENQTPVTEVVKSDSPNSGTKEGGTLVKESEIKHKGSEGIVPDDLKDKNTKERESSKEKVDNVKVVPTGVEKKGVKKDKKSTESTKSKGAPVSDKPGSAKFHKQLIEQCMAALCLCLSRFPTHYKSLYRLAYTYIYSPYHKNLQYAHDLLLGNPDWKMMAHMPAQGLFVDRKPSNFFQGVWKIPVDEIDRSGGFPSHLTRSVKLLLKVLKEQKDVPKLHSIFIQLSRDPDSGKKYMRDAERVKFARLAHQYCLDAIKGRMSELRRSNNHAKAVKCLMEVYKVYNYISFKMDISQTIEANELLEDTYRAVMGKKVLEDEEVLEQAIRFCQEEVQRHKARQNQPPVGKIILETSGKDGNQSDSSFFSPEKPVSLLSKVGGQSQGATNMTQGSKLLEKEKKGPISPFQENFYRTMSASESPIGKPKQLPSPVGVGMPAGGKLNPGTVKQTTAKSGTQGVGLPGKLPTTGVSRSKVMQKTSTSTQKSSLISTVKTNIPKERFVGETKGKSLSVSGKGACGFKPYNPNNSSAPSPVSTPATPNIGLSTPATPNIGLSTPATPNIVLSTPATPNIGLPTPATPNIGLSTPATPNIGLSTPATPNIGLSPKFDYSRKGDPATSLPVKKVIEVIEISSSDDEGDMMTNSGKAGDKVQQGGPHIGKGIASSQKGGGNSLRTLLQGGEYQSAPKAGSTGQGGKGAGQPKGANLPIQRPYPTGIVYNKGGIQVKQLTGSMSKDSQGNQIKPSQKSGGPKGNNSAGHKLNQPTSQVHPGYVMYGAKVTPPLSHQKPFSQESITDDSDLSEREDKTYQPSEESSSDEDPRTNQTNPQSTSVRRPSKSGTQPATAYIQDNVSIRILNTETGQVVDSDSQKSDLVTDPEKLFFDVKDWLDDL
ncbi:Calcineurin-binding protein cabin-1 [Mizuhopecten yessoensis]|uniref:Calcineurin-binding protein cabin-1 n=1 Tax=Mizuhopecten yessoensis TaxID=6573 RepID=A0A210QLV4_MIZYE|nr:Calcineurin-binding protein cabin-1 [Mizuhopecten yessoensis]